MLEEEEVVGESFRPVCIRIGGGGRVDKDDVADGAGSSFGSRPHNRKASEDFEIHEKMANRPPVWTGKMPPHALIVMS